MDLRTLLSTKSARIEDRSASSDVRQQTDSSFLDQDVYIVKVERSLFKIDEESLQQIPKLNKALQDGRIRPGQPFNLDIPCQPRVMKDIVHLLKKQVEGSDPYKSFQSAQVDIENNILRFVQQLQLADALSLESLANIIIGKIRALCTDTSSLDDALKNTRFEKYASDRDDLDRILGNETASSQKNERFALQASNMPLKSRDQGESTKFHYVEREQQNPTKASYGRKRKDLSQSDDSEEPMRIDKRTKTLTDSPGPVTQSTLQSSLFSPARQDALDLDSMLDFTQTINSSQLQNIPDSLELDDEVDWEAANEVDEDDFERDEDGIEDFEPDSFELAETEVTSDDIEELVMSDPVKFECIASPRPPPKNMQPVPEETLTSSPVSSSNPYIKEASLNTAAHYSARNEKADMAKFLELRLPDTQDRQEMRFDLETFFCRGLTSQACGSHVLIDPNRLSIFYMNNELQKDALSHINYTKILQFKTADQSAERPLIQVLLRHSIVPCNICYFVFKTHADLDKFVNGTRRFFANLRVIPMSSNSLRITLASIPALQSKKKEVAVSTQVSPKSAKKRIEVTGCSEDDDLPDLSELVRGTPQMPSPDLKFSKTYAESPSATTKKKLFNKKL